MLTTGLPRWPTRARAGLKACATSPTQVSFGLSGLTARLRRPPSPPVAESPSPPVAQSPSRRVAESPNPCHQIPRCVSNREDRSGRDSVFGEWPTLRKSARGDSHVCELQSATCTLVGDTADDGDRRHRRGRERLGDRLAADAGSEDRGPRPVGHQTRPADLPSRDVWRRGLLGRHARPAPRHRRGVARRRRSGRQPEGGLEHRPEGGRQRDSRRSRAQAAARRSGPRRARDHRGVAEAGRGRRHQGTVRSGRYALVSRDHLRPVPLGRGQCLRDRHRSSAGRVGEPRPRRRRHHRARTRPVVGGRPARHRSRRPCARS